MNTTIYAVEPRIVAVVPHQGAIGNIEGATANIEFFNAHFREHGPGVVISFVDGLISQDSAARRAYREHIDRSVVLGGAMIAGSLLGRAIGTFFLKVIVTDTPFRLFGNYQDALAWSRNVLQDFDEQAR